MANPSKPKRKLTAIDFSSEGAHVALTHKNQGGPANGHDYHLIMKSTKGISPEFIQKVQKIQIEMELPEFLEKFFGLYGSDGEVLARLMGYVKPETEVEDEDWWENYIEERLSAFTIIKSLHESDDLTGALSRLTEDQYLDVLNDQVVIEKAMKEFTEGDKPEVDSSTKPNQVEKNVEPSGSKAKTIKEKDMTIKTPETVEKSADHISVEKALDEHKVQLAKALETIEAYKAAEKAAIVKSRTDTVSEIIKDEKQRAVVLKTALAIESEEDFKEYVEVMKALATSVDKSALFQEQGASADSTEDKPTESAVMRILKAQKTK